MRMMSDVTDFYADCDSPEYGGPVWKLLHRIEALDNGTISFADINFIGLTNIYLYCSCAYYQADKTLMSDIMFDCLCGYLAENFEILEMMDVRGVGTLIVEDNLKAGTCLGVEYPVIVQRIVGGMIAMQGHLPK